MASWKARACRSRRAGRRPPMRPNLRGWSKRSRTMSSRRSTRTRTKKPKPKRPASGASAAMPMVKGAGASAAAAAAAVAVAAATRNRAASMATMPVKRRTAPTKALARPRLPMRPWPMPPMTASRASAAAAAVVVAVATVARRLSRRAPSKRMWPNRSMRRSPRLPNLRTKPRPSPSARGVKRPMR